jgi:tRNA (guanine37-N1)-methyltransferase
MFMRLARRLSWIVMRFEILTIFPGFFSSIFENGILRRALAEGLVEVAINDLRNFTHDRHRTVDDRPFGGGEGMVLKPEPLAEALAALGIEPKSTTQPVEKLDILNAESLDALKGKSLDALKGKSLDALKVEQLDALKGHDFSRAISATKEASALAAEGTLKGTGFSPYIDAKETIGALAPGRLRTQVILLSAQGRPFTQPIARELAALDRVVLICGRYEGVDERINQLYCDMELSIGDYVLSGGELAAAVVIDATMRLIPGVLGNEASGEFESFGVADAEITTAEDGVPRSQHGSGGLLDYPHYTRPAEFAGLRAPDVLLNGDHLQIRRWRREQQLRKTLANRPDLLANAALSLEDRKLLETFRQRQAT